MTKQDKANALVDALKQRTDNWGDCKFPRARVWVGGERVRVYTGHASEYVEIDGDEYTASRVNMTWGADVEEAIESIS